RVRARIKMPDASGLAYGGALYARPRTLVSFNSTVAVWRLLAWRGSAESHRSLRGHRFSD
ncbi:MAG TPA: hypothetical protein VGA15_12470, partial [Bradyrhizobium sp.]